MEVVSEFGQLTKQELTSVMRMSLLKKTMVLNILSVLVLSVIICGSLYYLYLGKSWFIKSWLPLEIVIILYWFYTFLYLPQSKKFYKLNKNAFINNKYTLSNEFFISEGEDKSHIKIPLAAFHGITALEDYILLWENPCSVQIIPLRLFSENDRVIAKNIIQGKNA